MGSEWAAVKDLWWRLEESSGFSSKTKPHPTTCRPKAVGVWVKNARKGTPEFVVEAMEKEWWAWWMAMNPKWRLRAADGNLAKEGDGSWDVLRCPGQNGFLNVIICLKWWRTHMDTASDAWERAVVDVKWVLEQMVG
ncbi:hypothetical protein B0H13DRAFT_1589931 [Mycena leptocephala]|nr:hypothetical protein B0H13DRAFT_1589931 [Mycena leptocephala]